MFQVVNNSVAIGSENEQATLHSIAQKGYKAVIDLCGPAEAKRLDADAIQALGLSYTSIPVTPANLNTETLNSFVEVFNASKQPLYVYCSSGTRAGIFTLLALMEKEEINYLEKLQTWGIQPQPTCPINNFALSYLQSPNEDGELN
ncbi:MAG: hypothetical protein IGS23_24805 [Rivularia sp. T60_A2020_040]|nr:hypothetical protein [Rivularia sp. T60_A2020_040]